MSYLEVGISDGVTSSTVATTSGSPDTTSPVTAATTQFNFGLRSGGSGGPAGGNGITGDMTLTATVNGVPEPIVVAGLLQSGWTSNPAPSAYNAGTSYSAGDFVYHPTSSSTYTCNSGPGTMPAPPSVEWDAGAFRGHYEYGGWNYVIARDTPWSAGASVVIDASGDSSDSGALSCSGSFTVEGGGGVDLITDPTALDINGGEQDIDADNGNKIDAQRGLLLVLRNSTDDDITVDFVVDVQQSQTVAMSVTVPDQNTNGGLVVLGPFPRSDFVDHSTTIDDGSAQDTVVFLAHCSSDDLHVTPFVSRLIT